MRSIPELDDCDQIGTESVVASDEAVFASSSKFHSHRHGPQSNQPKQLPTADPNMLKGGNEMMMDVNECNASSTITTTAPALSPGRSIRVYFQASATGDGCSDDGKPPESSPPCQVKFVARSKLHYIPHINDIPPDVIASTWYNRTELDDTQKSYQITVQMIMKGHIFTTRDEATNSHCTRGLEHRTREGARFKQKIKVLAMLAVLEEQERQKQEGTSNPELIAQQYRHESDKATSRAFAQGLKDELIIQDYLRAEELAMTTSSLSCSLEEGDENEGVDNSDCMVDISLAPCPDSSTTSIGCSSHRRPEDSSGGHIFSNNPAHMAFCANVDLSPTEEKRNRMPIARGLNQAMTVATSNRQQVLEDIEAVLKKRSDYEGT
jgi:hypothetical protein